MRKRRGKHARGMEKTGKALPPRHVGRPRREEREQIETRILEVARRSFLTRGFNDTTINSVAAEAALTRRSVMHRYPGKEALLLAVVHRQIAAANVLAVQGPDEAEPVDMLRRLCRVLLASATDPVQTGIFRICMAEIGRLPALSEPILQLNNQLAAQIEAVVIRAQAHGKFRNCNAAALATSAIGMMLSNPIVRGAMGDEQFSSKSGVDAYFERMWTIFTQMA